MTDAQEEFDNGIAEIREARNQAEMLRDQLTAEYQRLKEQNQHLPPNMKDTLRRKQGQETIKKAIIAADRAIASIDQAMRELQQVQDQDDPTL